MASNTDRARPRRRCSGDQGAALVEFALIAPLLFALLLGTITGGFALARKNSMTNAVREGARLGATLPDSSTWAASVQTRVDEIAGSDLSASQVCVELAAKTAGGESTVRELPVGCSATTYGPEPAMPSDVAVGTCVVKVRARRTSPLEAVILSRNLTLDASAVARYERGGTGSCG